jgi:hypothetical protein
MANLTAHVRLRPIRFGFLVKPDDGNSLLQVFRVNTCLWGGRFNPIIPHLRTVPRWWDRHGHRFESAKQIVDGYLDFFEPDFIVESVPGLAEGVAFDSKRVLSLSGMLRHQPSRANVVYPHRIIQDDVRLARPPRPTAYAAKSHSVFTAMMARIYPQGSKQFNQAFA